MSKYLDAFEEFIARVAVDEDADALGLSILSGSHNALVEATIRSLKELGKERIKVFVGGTIPAEDYAALEQMGVAAIFTSEMKLEDVVSTLADQLK